MTLTDLLGRFGLGEQDFVDALSRQLRARPAPDASRLTDAESTLIEQHGGLAGEPSQHQATKAALLSASDSLAAEIRGSLPVEAVALLLDIDASRVRHRVRDGALYGFKIGASRRLPAWQFEDDAPIPGLRAVLAALPEDLHPLEVAGFMTTLIEDLAVADVPRSPRDWLSGGGAVAAVVELARDLDAW